MRIWGLVLAVMLGCGDDDETLDCSEWLAFRDGRVPDAGPLPDGGGYSLGSDSLRVDQRCWDMYPP